MLRRLSDHRLHVVIDSCHSYFLVNARGRRVAVAEAQDSLDRYPSVGFLLSTSRGKEVHEWSGYGGGVFTYQLLSAMRGAADVDGDGAVAYSEAHAYLAAANMDVTDPRARIEPFVQHPTLRGDTLIRPGAADELVPVEEEPMLVGSSQHPTQSNVRKAALFVATADVGVHAAEPHLTKRLLLLSFPFKHGPGLPLLK